MAAEQFVRVRRQWNDYRIARYRADDVTGIRWDNVSGGVQAPTPQYFLHGYVWCNGMVEGELAHSCAHGYGPHNIKVCILQVDNTPEIMAPFLQQCGLRPAMPPSIRRIAKAYHEAGHAVAAAFLNRPFHQVRIVSDRQAKIHGRCTYPDWPTDLDPEMPSVQTTDRIQQEILIAYAGHAAEAEYCDRRIWSGSEHDRQRARDLASAITYSDAERDAYLKKAWVQAKARVWTPDWGEAIEAVAEALLAQRTLRAVQIAHLMR